MQKARKEFSAGAYAYVTKSTGSDHTPRRTRGVRSEAVIFVPP